MKVFKFGGASINSIGRMRDTANLLKAYKEEKLLVVISALGKTTNALEEVVNAFTAGDQTTALSLFNGVKAQHSELAAELLGAPMPQLDHLFTEVEWLLYDKPVREYDYYYDQVVCAGELLSTAIMSQYLHAIGVANTLLDVRDLLRTDNNFRNATVDWEVTGKRTQETVLPLFERSNLVITQGFIGATDENESTTLGREGSDYTAAVFANLLQASSLTIWKDVPGVMNADPKQYPKAQLITHLGYEEVIEMAYYGAQVIHPKTIKPLHNKEIPLYVRSFLHPDEQGTLIHSRNNPDVPPVIVYKERQVMIELRSKDFSFVGEGLTQEIYGMFERLKFGANLTQNGAISLLLVVDDHPEKVGQLASEAAGAFDVRVTPGLHLLTVRHYNDDILEELGTNGRVILRQQTPATVQLLIKPNAAWEA
jgi:aspartate kinase